MRENATRLALLAGAVGALLMLVACASQPEKAEASAGPVAESNRKSWDAEEMTRLSGELARAIRDVRNAWRRDPAFREPQNPNRRAALRLDDTLRSLDQRATQLASRVKSGGGYDETFNIARNIGVLLNDVDVEGRRIAPNEFMEARVRPTMAIINEIAPYYGSGPLYDPETMQRLDRPPRTR